MNKEKDKWNCEDGEGFEYKIPSKKDIILLLVNMGKLTTIKQEDNCLFQSKKINKLCSDIINLFGDEHDLKNLSEKEIFSLKLFKTEIEEVFTYLSKTINYIEVSHYIPNNDGLKLTSFLKWLKSIEEILLRYK
jgi:hypothetical protein